VVGLGRFDEDGSRGCYEEILRQQKPGRKARQGGVPKRKGKKMMQRIRNLKAHEGGFTLIELLIVIVILGILAAIVVFAVGGITDRGTLSACKSDKKSIEVGVEAAFAQNAAYPANVAALVPTFLHQVPSTAHYTLALSAATPPLVTVAAGTVDGPPAGC